MANWYRPGASEFDGFSALYTEMAQYHVENTGILLVGDLNIHYKRWLHFSREDTRVGAEMKVFCDFHGLFQIVRAPTRNDYLLDLAITDMTGAKASVLPRIADHNAVKIELPLQLRKAEEMLKSASADNANCKICWEDRTVLVNDVVAFTQGKGLTAGKFASGWSQLSL